MTDIVKLRADAIEALRKSEQAQRYFLAGRCRLKQRNAARKRAADAVAAWQAIAMPGAAIGAPVFGGASVPRRSDMEVANDR